MTIFTYRSGVVTVTDPKYRSQPDTKLSTALNVPVYLGPLAPWAEKHISSDQMDTTIFAYLAMDASGAVWSYAKKPHLDGNQFACDPLEPIHGQDYARCWRRSNEGDDPMAQPAKTWHLSLTRITNTVRL